MGYSKPFDITFSRNGRETVFQSPKGLVVISNETEGWVARGILIGKGRYDGRPLATTEQECKDNEHFLPDVARFGDKFKDYANSLEDFVYPYLIEGTTESRGLVGTGLEATKLASYWDAKVIAWSALMLCPPTVSFEIAADQTTAEGERDWELFRERHKLWMASKSPDERKKLREDDLDDIDKLVNSKIGKKLYGELVLNSAEYSPKPFSEPVAPRTAESPKPPKPPRETGLDPKLVNSRAPGTTGKEVTPRVVAKSEKASVPTRSLDPSQIE